MLANTGVGLYRLPTHDPHPRNRTLILYDVQLKVGDIDKDELFLKVPRQPSPSLHVDLNLLDSILD